MDKIAIHFTVKELDFVVQVLGAIPQGQALQAGMLGLLPNILEQANTQGPTPAPVGPSE